MKRFCTNCGQKIPSDSAFCKHCGSVQPKAETTSPRNKKIKKFCLISGAVIALLALTFVLLLVTAKPRIYGTWEREVMYLPKYDCDCILTITFNHNGSATEILTNADTGELLHLETGRWRMEGFEVQYVEDSESFLDGHTPYSFNPLTGKLKNNLLFTKIR